MTDPQNSFHGFHLHPRLDQGLQAAGYTTPTPIQRAAIPAALAGRDLLGLAQTGTGKTAAFVLPLLHRLMDGPRSCVRALVVAPTRELAEQIHGEIGVLGRATGLRSATVYGGVGMAPQARALRGGAEIIVACPGRLLDHLERGTGTLAKLEVLVLDEADHMFDMGFLPAVRKLVGRVPEGAQRLLFSATMPPELRRLAEALLRAPVTLQIGRTEAAATVSHALYPVAREQKTALLKHLLRHHDIRSALVFTRTKRGAKRLAESLERDNFFATSLQGNLSQTKRQKALDAFRAGEVHVLVATDIAARGIDVARVSHVFNYDVPTTAEAYTHRIGRTGRAARTGEACTFVTPDDEGVVRQIERALKGPLRRVRLEGFAYLDPVAAPSESGQAARAAGPQGPRGKSPGHKRHAPSGAPRSGRSGAQTPARRARSGGRPAPKDRSR